MRQAELHGLIAPAVAISGLKLWGCEQVSDEGSAILRIYIDGPDGVTIEDCEAVSRQVSAVLDVEDPMSGRYRLEVSSPGIFRPLFGLEHYKYAVSKQIKLKTRQPIDNRRNFKGLLKDVDEQSGLVMVVDDVEIVIPIENIDKASIEEDL